MTYLNNYFRVLENKQAKEFTLFEQFGNGLTNFASGNLEVKKIINEMNETASNYGNELEAFMLIEQIQDPAAQEAVRDAYNNYLNCEDEKSCNLLIDAVDLVNQQQDPVGPQLTIIITNDSSSRLPKINYEDDLTISKFEEIQQKIRDEKNKKRLESIKDEVMNYANQVFDEAKAEEEAEKASCTFENIVNNNGIKLAESIKNIASSDARSNKRLMETLDQYAGALTQGLYEERLFEGFVQNLSKYNYLLPVEKEIKRLNEVAKENANGILITKILEEMSVSPTSYWLMHIIEEDAARYVKYPNDMNKTQFKNVLVQYASDPYCNALIEALSKDNCALVETLDEKSLAVKDKIKLIREDANVSSIYSPVQYIKENECVFNANGQFYVKKGNTLAKLNPEYINQLREDFIALAQLVNDPHVKINEDSITLVGNDKVATIYEGYVDINGCRETTDTLRDLNEMCMKYDFDTNFFIMASCLHENYNKIAKVDFAKHISLNANEGINLDMFRLGNNIFINTVNEDIDKSTFYHNVNPLQCRNIINRHMGINVASLFEDLIPSQEKILLKLNETKEEYEASIEKYENMISRLKKAKDECVSVDNEEKLDTAIESAETKLDELKKEYKQWQKDVKDNTDKVDDDEKENQDDNTEVEEPNKPIDAKEVDDVKDELAQPLDNDETSVEDEEDPTITDDEFDSYLNGDEDGEESAFVEEPESQETSSEEGEDEMQLNTANTEEEPVEEPTTETEPNDELNGFAEVNIDEPTAEEPVEEPTTDECPEGECQTEPEVEPTEGIGEPANEEPVEDELTTEGYKIANISFDRNVKTGEIFRTGTVIVVCPKVDASGRMYVDSNTYKFYINDETNLPVVDAADVPVALYNAITAAIIDEEGYENAISAGVSANDTVEQPENFFLPADEVSTVSDELEKNDDDDFFEYNDDEDSFTITPKEDETSETSDVIIPTYKSEDGKTDIELPAPQADGTAIPEELPKEDEEIAKPAEEEEEKTEEVKPAPAKPVHESRNLIVGISSQFKKNGKDFFLNEGTIKPSKKEVSHVNETNANIDGIDQASEEPVYEPYEDYSEETDMDEFGVLHARVEKALAAYPEVQVSDIENLINFIPYFKIEEVNGQGGYVCYMISNMILYRSIEEFDNILKDVEIYDGPIQEQKLLYALVHDYENPEIEKDYVKRDSLEDIKDLAYTLATYFKSQYDTNELLENIKIRRPKLSSNGDVEKSKLADDALHGDKERRDFEDKVEQETQKAGVDNPLAPSVQPQEEHVQILPNVHNPVNEEAKAKLEGNNITYEPMDKVIIKETNETPEMRA